MVLNLTCRIMPAPFVVAVDATFQIVAAGPLT
jgi:hypothetical protein